MIRNYFKIAWRNLCKNKGFSVINILGLSIGLACCILMFLFIQNELSYDKYNEKAKNIYRLTSRFADSKEQKDLAVTPAPWAPLMKKDYPEIKEYVRLLKDEKAIIGQPGQQHFYETQMLYADSTFFNVFSVGLERGDIRTALDKPNAIILTKEAAHKYFANADPIGKTLEISSFGRSLNVEVTAIAREIPSNSHFQFNSLVSMQTLGDMSQFWAFHMFQSYVVLNDKISSKEVENKFKGFVDKYITNNPQADGKQDIQLQPLTSIHLYSKMTGEIGTNSDIAYVYVFAGVALFILIIACFNFTNLSTARSFSRAKEVGLRKVIGAVKGQLLKQFLGEASLLAFIALLLAVLIAFLALPLFNQLSGRELHMDFTGNYSLVILLVMLVLFVGLLAGLYPAAVLSSFKPIEVLKGKFGKRGGSISFRKALIVLQFVVSITLIASTILVNKQLKFLQNKELGFNKENVAILTLPRNTDSTTLASLEAEIGKQPGISSVAASSMVPGVQIPINQVNDGSADLTKAESMQMLFVDNNFVHTMNMKIVAGRDFSADYPTDMSEGFVVNEEAVKKMGWGSSQKAIGKTFQWVQPSAVIKKGKIIGVVQDFNITPLRSAVQPLVMHIVQGRYQYLYVRFDQVHADQVINNITGVFNRFYVKQTPEYIFLDDKLVAMYSDEKKLGTIFNYFSFLAILIACMGILGLSLYTIQQRVKEVGIRKLLGASVAGITGILLKEFVKPVLIAAVIASPLAWWFINSWLKDFAYRTNISMWVFVVAGAIALVIAVVTVSVQAIRAAVVNPVQSLRSE